MTAVIASDNLVRTMELGRGDLIQHVPTRRVGRFVRESYPAIARVRFPNTDHGELMDWPLVECVKVTTLTPDPPAPAVDFDHRGLDRVNGLPVDQVRNRRTGELGQAVKRRTWQRHGRAVPMIDVRLDTGGNWKFVTWTINNCEVLLGQRILAAR